MPPTPSVNSDYRVLLSATRAFELQPNLPPNTSPVLQKASKVEHRKMNVEDYDNFLPLRPPGNADLVVHSAGQEVFTFRNLNEQYLEEACPLLAFSFEERARGRKFLSISATSIELVARFLRYIYTSSYHIVDDQGLEVSCTFPMHAQLYHYGELYDMPAMMGRAYLHIAQICELGCSMPSAPIGLVETLRFLYENVKGEKACHEAILHYCINCFNSHRLGMDQPFLKLLEEVKECQNDLFRLVGERGYRDDSSSNIIQLPLPGTPRQMPVTSDYLYDMFGASNFSTPAQTPLLSAMQSPDGFSLVFRPHHIGDMPATADSDGYSSDGSLVSDFENFSLENYIRRSLQNSTSNSRAMSPARADLVSLPVCPNSPPRSDHRAIAAADIAEAFASHDPDDADLAADAFDADGEESEDDDGSNNDELRASARSAFYEQTSASSSRETVVAAPASGSPPCGEDVVDAQAQVDSSESEWEEVSAEEVRAAAAG